MDLPPALTEKLVRLAQNLTKDTLDEVAHKFSSHAECPEERIVHSWVVVPERAQDLREIAQHWQSNSEISGGSIADFLYGAWNSWNITSRDQGVKMLITGPRAERNTIPSLSNEVFDVIRASKKRLLLTTYNAHPTEELLAELKTAEDRGVLVELVFESSLEGSDHQKCFESLEKVEAYVWPQENRPNKSSSTHAKCILADDEYLIVSSANLSFSALERNLELGVLIRGGDEPGLVRRYIDELILEQHLEKYSSLS